MTKTFESNFEAGTFAEWTRTVVDGGDLSVTSAAALAGSNYGLQVVVNDNTAIYAEWDPSGNTSPDLRCRFYIDPNGITISANIYVLRFYNSSGSAIINVVMDQVSGSHTLEIRVVDDTGAEHNSARYEITDEPHYVEIHLKCATNATSKDGFGSLWIDGSLKETVSGIDNYDRFFSMSLLRVGQVFTSGASGTFYMDAFVVNDDGSLIGPVGGGTPVTLVIQDASHSHTADNLTLTQGHYLVVQDSRHGHSADNLVLTQSHFLAVQDGTHGHTADNLNLTQSHYLVVQDGVHPHTVDSLALTQTHVLVISDAFHQHTADHLSLSGEITLVIQKGLHGHVADSLTLTQAHFLVVSDAFHAHSADEISMTQAHVLEVQGATHPHSADELNLTQVHILVVQDGFHDHTADELKLTLDRIWKEIYAAVVQIARGLQTQVDIRTSHGVTVRVTRAYGSQAEIAQASQTQVAITRGHEVTLEIK